MSFAERMSELEFNDQRENRFDSKQIVVYSKVGGIVCVYKFTLFSSFRKYF